MSDQIKELELENQKLKRENDLLTGWISLVSHDTKQLFGSLKWVIDALECNSLNQEDFLRLLPQLKKDVNKSLQTAVDTGDWLRTQFGNFKPKKDLINAKTLFDQLQETFKEKLTSKNIELNFEGNIDLQVISDKILLSFIFEKIIDNAIKYSAPEQHIIFEVLENDTDVILSITDQGTGIKKNYLSSIYEFDTPVFQGTAGEIGAGLSLKIVQSFVFLICGSIEIDSSENCGTCVTIRLPQTYK